ncbi:MobC family plasmid mobilization relaxosome protein [Actinacidiphila guanduensis]|uniref:MobC family plasmid mobilization relaxosome protein n=1 Tax=Actinacidiphila guanduensis TaxID=310781 RepID=UPI001FE80FF4|nr:MobC family plasmid mobilization relaxosome protein [Actinacidiphila guanduensis]
MPAAEREGGPGVPAGEKQPPSPSPSSAAVRAAPRRRLRQSSLRQHRICPRFSDDEWTAVQQAAHAADLSAGGYTAAAALAAASSANPTAAVADYRRGVQELMESNRQLAAVGNNLNQVAHFLNAGGQPATDLRRLLHRIDTALNGVDDAVAWLVRR